MKQPDYILFSTYEVMLRNRAFVTVAIWFHFVGNVFFFVYMMFISILESYQEFSKTVKIFRRCFCAFHSGIGRALEKYSYRDF